MFACRLSLRLASVAPAHLKRRTAFSRVAAYVLLAVEHVVVIVRPRAARAGFGGAFEGEHVNRSLDSRVLTC